MQNMPGDYHGDEDESNTVMEECSNCHGCGWIEYECPCCDGEGEIEIEKE